MARHTFERCLVMSESRADCCDIKLQGHESWSVCVPVCIANQNFLQAWQDVAGVARSTAQRTRKTHRWVSQHRLSTPQPPPRIGALAGHPREAMSQDTGSFIPRRGSIPLRLATFYTSLK